MMSVTSEYALRVMITLANEMQDGSGAATVSELAEKTKIPYHYLSKIMVSLKEHGLLGSSRGRGGGYTLKKPVSKIYLLDVVEVFEGPQARSLCFLNRHAPCGGEACPSKAYCSEMRHNYTGYLEKTTLDKILRLPVSQLPS